MINIKNQQKVFNIELGNGVQVSFYKKQINIDIARGSVKALWGQIFGDIADQTDLINYIDGITSPIDTKIDNHIADLDNPHQVTPNQIGTYTGDQIDSLLDLKEDAFSKNTAFNKNFGTTAGTVAEGNHNHSGVYEPANANIQAHIISTSNPHNTTASQVGAYTTGQTDTLLNAKADKTNVLQLDNTTPFTPDSDYEPATKKYVDDNIIIGSGDMLKSTYDINNNGIVDNSEKLNNQSASYYLSTDNHTNGTTNKVFTATEKTKLSGIEAGAQVNNISNVNATDLTDGGETTLHIHDGRYYTETETNNLLNAKANLSGATFTGAISATNLSNTNTGDETTSSIKTKLGTASTSTDGYLTSTDWNTFNNKQPSGSYEVTTNKGQANGYAPLNASTKIDSTYLPSYVDDVEEYANLASFPVTGESSKIYMALDTNLIYRWSGSAYVEISQSLALGETSSTAYRGDRGKTAYDHSQIITGNPHNTTYSDVGAEPANANIQSHISSNSNPHSTSHSQLSDTATNGHPASIISNTPAGNISSTDVQGAINELDTDKEPVVTAGTTLQYYNGDKTWHNMDDDMLAKTGFVSFSGTGNYYSVTGPVAGVYTLTLLRTATGKIKGKTIICNSGQTIDFSQYLTTYIGADDTGTLITTTSVSETWYATHYALFQVIADNVNHLVVWENHPAGTLQGEAGTLIHHTMRAIIGLYPGEVDEIGGNITRITTGTGTAITDRQIKIVGNAMLYDHGIESPILDTSGSAINPYFAYTDSLGRWISYARQTQMPMVYNNAGTITALGTGKFSIMSVYVTKEDPNNGTTYITVIGTNSYDNAGQATTALANGQVPKATGNLAKLEVALLGYLIIENNVNGGYIHTAQINKQTINGVGLGGGIGGTASLTTTVTTNFNNVLSSADTSVQLALDTLDNVVTQTITNGVTNKAPSEDAVFDALVGKEPTLTKGNLSELASSVLIVTGGTGAVIGSGTTIEVRQSGIGQSGYLSSADWSTFNSKEPAITTGTTAQYWRGDKSWQTLNKTAVGLGNVENTALSTWAGSTNITTLGTIATGTWNGTTIGVTKGGTGTTTQFTSGSVVFADGAGVYAQDNANFFWDDTNNRLGIGTTSPTTPLTVSGGNISVYGTGYNGVASYVNSDTASPYSLFLRSRGTPSTPTETLNNYYLGAFGFRGYTGSAYFTYDGARFAALAEQNGSAGYGTSLIFSTNPLNGVSDATERMRINATGYVGIGTVGGTPNSILQITKSDSTTWADASFTGASTYSYTAYPHEIQISNTVDNVANSYAGLYFRAGTTTGASIASGRIGVTKTGASTADFVVALRNGTDMIEKARIKASGSLLVGTTTDSARLTVKGSGNTSATNTALFENSDGTDILTIRDDKKILVGTSTSRSVGAERGFQIEGVDATGGSMSFVRNSNDVSGSNFLFGKSRGTTVGSNTIVQNNDIIGGNYFYGANGVDMNSAGAYTIAAVEGTPSVTSMPMRYSIYTAPDGSTTPIERLRVTASGKVGIGGAPTWKFDVNSETIANAYTSTSASQAIPDLIGRFFHSGLSANYPALIGFYDSVSSGYWYTGSSGGTGGYVSSFVIGNRTGSTAYTERMRILSTGNVGIGIDAPTARIHIKGSGNTSATNTAIFENSDGTDILTIRDDKAIIIPNTTFAGGNAGVILKGGSIFLHDFNYGNNGTVTTDGFNLFIGGSGNLTMGSTATAVGEASRNTGIGTGSLFSLTTGYNNVGLGASTLRFTTTGYQNMAIGYASLYTNVSGNHNVGVGNATMNASLGSYNTAIGSFALFVNSTCDNNVAIGYQAGRYIANGSTNSTSCTESVLLGSNTKVNASGETNQIVIGYNVTGLGSNSVVLGNDSITKTYLKGDTGIAVSPVIGTRLYVKGSGNTSATNTALFENSDSYNTLVIKDDKKILVGTDTSRSVGVERGFQIEGIDAGSSSLSFMRNSNDNTGAVFAYGKSRGTTVGSSTIVQNGDIIGGNYYYGANGTNANTYGAYLITAVDGTPSATSMPMRFSFGTVPDGSTTAVERLRIRNDGGISVGGTGSINVSLYNQRTISGGTTAWGYLGAGTIQPDVTSSAIIVSTTINTASNGGTPYTIGNLYCYNSSIGTINADTIVTNAYGFSSPSGLSFATNNYGYLCGNNSAITAGKTHYAYYSANNIATGGGTTWGFYANGTAPNYFNGKCGFGYNAPNASVHLNGDFRLNTGAQTGGLVLQTYSNDFYLNRNAYYTGATAIWTAEGANVHTIGMQNGGIYFYTDTGKTVGNTYTPSQRMKIGETGLVGVGTNPTTGVLLTVKGQGNTSATSTALFENSDGTDLFTIRDDGGFAFKGGTVGLAQTGWTTSNVTTDRVLNANSTTLDEVADVLATLIEDLKAKGIISA